MPLQLLELSVGMIIGILVGMWVMYAGTVVKKKYLTQLIKKMIKEEQKELKMEVKQ